MDLLSFIRTADLTKVRIGERQRDEDEPKLLETTVGRIVSLLPVASAHSSGDLEASVDKLFDGGAVETMDTVAEDEVLLQPRGQKKRKTGVTGAGESSHPPKKLRGGSRNLERDFHRGDPIPTLPFVTSSVSATPEREGEDSSHHSGANIAEAEVDSFVKPSVPIITAATTVTPAVGHAMVVKEKIVKPFLFSAESASAGTDSALGGFANLFDSDFLIGGICTVINPDTDLQKVYVPQWSVTNRSRLDDGRVCREMVDEFAPPKYFASIRGMEHDQLFTEFNVGAARQMSLSVEARMQAAEAIRFRAEAFKFEAVERSLQCEVETLKEHNTILEKEKNELDVKVVDLAAFVKVREQEVADLDAVVTSVKSQNDNLVKEVHELEVSFSELKEKLSNYEKVTERLEEFQDVQLKVMNDKFNKLYADFVEMALHLEEMFYPHLLTSIAGRRWFLTYGMELAIAKCLNSSKYFSALGSAIGKAIEKGMQDGMAVGITHGKEGRSVNFSLLTELKLNKDSSVETLMNILHLEETVAERLGLNESQPYVDQPMVLIHYSPDETVVSATALSLSLDVSHACVQKIRENIANYRSALRDVFIPLVEPFSTVALEGTGGTSNTMLVTADTTTALSMVVASTSIVRPISIDDYEVAGTDDQATADGNVADEDANPFPNVDNAELNVPE
nr:hypothetical protein [Tanacetum cinerariifolium]